MPRLYFTVWHSYALQVLSARWLCCMKASLLKVSGFAQGLLKPGWLGVANVRNTLLASRSYGMLSFLRIGGPSMTAGCGQTYVDLKRLNVKSVVASLLK